MGHAMTGKPGKKNAPPPAGLVQLEPWNLVVRVRNHLCALGKYTHVQTMHIVGAQARRQRLVL